VKGSDLQRSVNALVALANERGGEDNITVVMYGAPRRFGVADVGSGISNLVLALLALIVIVGTIAALVVASGALPTTR
jgi:hypothetical protein